MKTSMKLILGLLLTALSLQGFAQKPEPVYSFVRQIHDFDWYEQQAKVWKQEIDRGTKDKMAWVYFYRANRMARFSTPSKWKELQGDYFLPLEDIVKLAEKAIPNTFELYFLEAYEYGCYTERGRKNLIEAQKIRPFDELIFSDLMNYYQTKRDTNNIDLVSKKWFESNETPTGILNFNYNVLMSLENNAVLLVNGDNATYPLWILQHAKQIRKDILVLNVSLLGINEYRDKIFKENSITPFDSFNIDKNTMGQMTKHIIKSVKSRPVYVSLQMDQDIYQDYRDKLYMVGLALKYSEKPFDNLAVLQNNIENKFLLDDLKIDFRNDYARTVVNQSNLSYLAVFLKLYEHYLQCGEVQKAQKLKELAKTVSDNAGDNDWMKYFEK
jgi:hypothetical protein